MIRVDRRGVIALLRLPSVLTVPGDALVGMAWASDSPSVRRSVPVATASSLLYLSGMALNDYADRDIDARERPSRPIPAGRVSPGLALALSSALSAGGVAVAGYARGRRTVSVAAALTAVVWGYDLALKDGKIGPATMAAARTLDVLLGASTASIRRALTAAAVMGAHTLTITVVSRREVSGAPRSVAYLALAASAATGAAATTLTLRAGRRSFARPLALALSAAYTASMVAAEVTAARRPDPAALQHVVKTGVMAFLPLQASLVSARGLPGPALLLAVAWPAARALAQRIAVT